MAQNTADASAASTGAHRYGPVQEGTDRGAMINEINELRSSLAQTRGEAHQAFNNQHQTLALEARQELERQAAGYATAAQMHDDAVQRQSRDMISHEAATWNTRHTQAMTTAEGDLARIQLQEQSAQLSVHNLRSELQQSQGHSSMLMEAASSSSDSARAAAAGEQQLEAKLQEQRLQLNVAEHNADVQTKEIVKAEEQLAKLQDLRTEVERRGEHIEKTRVFNDGQTLRYNENVLQHKQEIQGLQLNLGDSSYAAEILQQKVSQVEMSLGT